MELLVKNWKCIEEARIDLNTITVLMGRNSAGKSALAYAPYFFAKLMEIKTLEEIPAILNNPPFFASNLDDLVRKDECRTYYPLVVQVNGSGFEYNNGKIIIKQNKIWDGAELLSSGRLYLHRLINKTSESDGTIDYDLIRKTFETCRDNSLIIIEEPEIHKHPLLIINLVKYIIKKALEKNLTVIMTTHSDILFHAIVKAVEMKEIESSKVSVYYLIRNRWCEVKEIKVYDDGTFDVLPDISDVISKLF